MLIDFRKAFEILTANPLGPFPWQESLFLDWFSQGKIPTSCCLPTGMGKTSIVAVWLIALGYGAKLPRRLVYVVNRRTVVDQTTNEVERLRENLSKLEVPRLDALAVSTLRGQFADNREWSADPSRPAVIVGTVDMIGSRLLFSGYGVGFKAKPLHAGFLGQDALVVHDEAHLEPAFQKLLECIAKEQKRCKELARLCVMEMTATTRSANGSIPFELTAAEKNPPEVIPEFRGTEPPIHTVWRRLTAKKDLKLSPAKDEKAVPGEIARIAERYKDQQAAVLVFVQSPKTVAAIRKELEKTKRQVKVLTGTIRGKERDDLVKENEFKRFLKGAAPGGTVYLVCTSAGEVGIDISADHLVCDLSTLDSMSQRFGRVNRYGLRTSTCIHVVYPPKFDEKEINRAREATLEILQKLEGDASPIALGNLRDLIGPTQNLKDAFTPEPIIPPATDMLFDAWALTSIRRSMPGRPPIEPYLHGVAEWQPPETYVAWREEVGVIKGDLLDQYQPEDLIEDYPLLPHELLRDESDRVFKQLEALAKKHPDSPVWILDEWGGIRITTLRSLAEDRVGKSAIENKTVLLPPSVGGLTKDGMLDGESPESTDVADLAVDEGGRPRRKRVWDDASIPPGFRVFREIDAKPDAEEAGSEDAEAPRILWKWCDRPREGGRASNRSITLDEHVSHVMEYAKKIVAGLDLPEEISDAVILAAKLPDHGKRREQFQLILGNRDPNLPLAKANGRAVARFSEPFRHEFASVLDGQDDPEFVKLSAEMQDLVLHLIASHHGRARPHFDPDEALDPQRPGDAKKLSLEIPRRFARLQRMHGRWGLAYLESLLRAADWAASAAEAEVTS